MRKILTSTCGALLACLLLGCASTPPDPFLGQGVTLRFGVDQADEAGKVQASFKQAGYQLAQRIEGQLYIALSFRDAQGQPRAVRVVTARGIALALDTVEASALATAVSYELLDAANTFAGATKSHSESLLVLEHRGSGEQCVRPFTVTRDGLVLGQSLGLPDPDAPVCAQEAADRDGDGRAELTAEYRVNGLPLPVVPVVQALLFADSMGIYSTRGPQTALDAYYETEASGRSEALNEYAAQQVAMEVYRLAVELALITHLRGQDAEAQKNILKQAFELLPQDKREADWEQAMMARVGEGW